MCSSGPRCRGLGVGLVALSWLVGCHVDALFHPNAATNPPDIRLAFAPPPNGAVNQPLAPPIKVSAVDSAGRVDTTFTLGVTITLDANPGRAALAGTRTVAAVKGVATFADLSLSQADTGYTFLATAPGLRGVTSPSFAIAAGPPTTGDLTVTAATTGASQPSGYTVTVDGGGQKSLGATDSVTYTGLPASSHTVALGGVPASCTVSGGVSQSVTVTAGDTARASFTITCQAPTGSVAVTTVTSGSNIPTADYTVSLDAATGQPIHPSGTFTFTGVSTGNHTVTLGSVPSNCSVTSTGGASQTVTVTANQAAPVTFNVSCATVAPPTGTVGVTTSTTGLSLDPDGYTVTVSGSTGGSKPIGINQTVPVMFTGVSTGDHTVTLTGVAANCTVTSTGGATQTVTVSANQTVTATFAITCTALPGTLTVTTSTSGPNAPSGYTFSMDGGAAQAIGASASVPVSVSAGSHAVVLAGVPGNCSVSGGTSQTVNVPAGGSATASFTITCQALTGSLTVTTSTTGSNAPGGYTFSVDGGAGQAIGASASVPVSVNAGSHTVALGGVLANCSVSGGTTQTVNVPAGGSASASFTITCQALSGSLTVTTSTSGSNPPSGYTFSVDGGTAQTIGPNNSVPVSGLSAGSHTVQLNAVPSNCSVSGGTSQTVNVPAGGSATSSFTITCTALTGSLTVTTSTTGSNAPGGYTFSVDGGAGQAIGASASVPVSVNAGSHTVALGAVPANCSVSGGTSQTVNVPAGSTGSTSFSITCTAPNQPPVVTVGPDQNVLVGALFTLSGASFTDPDHNGPWTVTIDWGDGSSPTTFTASEGPVSASHSYATLLPATYTLTVTVTDAGGLSGSASETVNVGTL